MNAEPDVTRLMTVAEAIAVIDAEPVAARTMQVSLAGADGLVLAGDITADRDYPPFDKSQMDGFAVRCGDVAKPGAELTVVEQIAAGVWPTRTIAVGECAAIMTGAPLPAGADCVVPVEDTDRVSPTRVRIRTTAVCGRFIAKRGSDIDCGKVVLAASTILGPAQLAVAASVGASTVEVHPRPTATILGTGDELVAIDQQPGPAQIRNSNNLMLASLLGRLGCDVTDAGIVRDIPGIIRSAIEQGLRSDVLFITGGMSMGEFDYVPKILADLGVAFRITKLRIKPGKPFVFGVKTNTDRPRYIFGLPGNPVSGYVCTVRLAARLIARLRGDLPRERWITATLTADLAANGPREFYQPVLIRNSAAEPLQWKGSADLYTLARANALLPRPENDPPRQPGDIVEVLEVP